MNSIYSIAEVKWPLRLNLFEDGGGQLPSSLHSQEREGLLSSSLNPFEGGGGKPFDVSLSTSKGLHPPLSSQSKEER